LNANAHLNPLWLLLTAAIALSAALSIRADDQWTLTTADFHRAAVSIQGMDNTGARVAAIGQPETTVPLDQLLHLERDGFSPALPTKFTLVLQDGGRIGGEPGTLKDEVLTWTSPAIGEIKLPFGKLRAIFRLAAPTGMAAEQKEDQVMLTNHDIVRGVIGGIEDGKILIQVGADTVPLPMASADSILFASIPRPAAPPAHEWRVRFADSSILNVAWLKIDDGKVLFKLPGEKDGDARAADLIHLLDIEQINGPVSWLSDRTPQVNQQMPFSSETAYPARMNLNVFGKPLRVGSRIFDRGIGVHANSVLIFPLDGSYKVFRTRYGIDTTGDASKAAVHVRVLLDGQVAYEEKDFRAFKLSPVCTVELKGAKQLTLEVTAAGPTDTQDRLDWIEPALIREAAPATAPAATSGAAVKP
jgi:hypothetical protein